MSVVQRHNQRSLRCRHALLAVASVAVLASIIVPYRLVIRTLASSFLASEDLMILPVEDSRASSSIMVKGTSIPVISSSTSTKQPPKILVVYSGPSTMIEKVPNNKNELYIRNLEFFIKHALDCTIQDFIIVLGHDVGPIYRDQLAALNQVCQQEYSHSIIMITRDNVCFDMESVRLVMHGNITDFLSYDYFVFVNCGTTGPVMSKNENKEMQSWTSAFIDKMDEKVKMTGLSMNCLVAHVQSMVYALDKVAMKLIKESDCVFDCRPIQAQNPNITDDDVQQVIISQYEQGMSQKLLANGFGITSLMSPEIVTEENQRNCTDLDPWLTTRMIDKYGKVPSLGEVIFFKTSRILTPETAALINFTGNIWWNW